MAEQASQERIAQLEQEVANLKVQNQELQGGQLSKARRKPGAWRRPVSIAVLLLGLVALVPAGILLWLDRTVVRPESYIASVGPVIGRPEVQAAVQKGASEAILTQVDVDQLVGEALPERAAFLAEPIAAQVKNYTGTAVGKIVASPAFAKVWVQANVRAQAAFMNIARNGSGDATVDVNDLYGYISQQLASTPLAPLAGKQLPTKVATIPVATVPALERIPHYVALLDAWRWVFLGLVAVLLALAVWAAPNRRRMFVWVGWGLVAAGLVTLAVVRITRAVMLDPIADATYRDAAVAVWQTVLNPFLIQILVTGILGLAIVLTGWLVGPGRAAVGIRRRTEHWLASARRSLLPAAEQSAVVNFTHRHHRAMQWGLLGFTLILLAISAPLTIAAVTSILTISAVLLLLLEFFAAPGSGGPSRSH